MAISTFNDQGTFSCKSLSPVSYSRPRDIQWVLLKTAMCEYYFLKILNHSSCSFWYKLLCGWLILLNLRTKIWSDSSYFLRIVKSSPSSLAVSFFTESTVPGGGCWLGSNVDFVLDLAKNGELQSKISNLGSLSLECSKYYAAQIVDAVAYMHSKDVIHR